MGLGKFDTDKLAFNLSLVDNFTVIYKLNKGSISDSIVIQTNETIFETFD